MEKRGSGETEKRGSGEGGKRGNGDSGKRGKKFLLVPKLLPGNAGGSEASASATW